jgi:hypothetical protein
MNVQLGEQGAAVPLDRRLRDRELVRDLADGEPVVQAEQHLSFPAGEDGQEVRGTALAR